MNPMIECREAVFLKALATYSSLIIEEGKEGYCL
jgi:hypothetical protein